MDTQTSGGAAEVGGSGDGARLDLGGVAKRLVVSLLGIGIGVFGVLLSVVVPALSNLFPHLRPQLPPRMSRHDHSLVVKSGHPHHDHRPTVSRRSQECHATSEKTWSAESLSTVTSLAASSQSPPSSTQTSPRSRAKVIHHPDNVHDASSGVSESDARYKVIPTPSDLPAAARTLGAAALVASSSPSSGNGFVATLKSSIGCDGCSMVSTAAMPVRASALPAPTGLDDGAFHVSSLASNPSSLAPTPRPSSDIDGRGVSVEGEDDKHQQRHQQHNSSPSRSASVPTTSNAASSTTRRHSLFSIAHLRRSSFTPSKLPQSSSGTVPYSPSSQSLPNALKQGSANPIILSQHPAFKAEVEQGSEKPVPASKGIGAVTVRRSMSTPCPLAARLKGKGKKVAPERTSDPGTETTASVDVEKENVSLRSKRSKSKRSQSSKSKRPAPLPLPPARTRPYEGPFYFPSPLASEYEKEMYVRSAREELRRGRGRVDLGSAASVTMSLALDGKSEENRRGSASRGTSSSRDGRSDVDEFGVIAGSGSKVQTGPIANTSTSATSPPTSAPAAALSFANSVPRTSTVTLPSSSHVGVSGSPTKAKSATARPRPRSMYSSPPAPSPLQSHVVAKTSTDDTRGVLDPEDRVKAFVAEPEQYDSAVAEGKTHSRRASTATPTSESTVASVSQSIPANADAEVPSSANFGASARFGWSMLKRHGKRR